MVIRRITAVAAGAGLLPLLMLATSDLGQNKTRDPSQIFEQREVMIPMRDGVRLHTEI